jgi:hypothetical protein
MEEYTHEDKKIRYKFSEFSAKKTELKASHHDSE